MKERPTKRKPYLFRLIILILFGAFLGISLYHFNATRLTGNSVPMPFGVGAAVVLSGSMEPELSVGDLIIVAQQEEYVEREIVVYQDGASTITHRIIRITEEEVIVKGDANNTEDAPISPDRIKGKVVLAIPLVGYLIEAIKTPIGTLLLLALAVVLLEFSFLNEKKEEQKKLQEIREQIDELKKKP